MEHAFRPHLAVSEIYRTLKPRGLALLTFPLHKTQTSAFEIRAEEAIGNVTHVRIPEYHGTPTSDKGSFVAFDCGYDIHIVRYTCAPVDAEVVRFASRHLEFIGGFKEVVILKKRRIEKLKNP